MANAVGGSAVGDILATKSASGQFLYLSLLSGEFLSRERERENNCGYNTLVVMLLMIIQRLRAEGCLESAVLELRGLPASLWPDPPAMSNNTGTYNKTRQKLPRRRWKSAVTMHSRG